MHTWSTSLPCWGLWVVYTCAWGLVWVCGVLLCLSATIGCCWGCKRAWVRHGYLGFWLVIPLSPVAWVTVVSLYWLLSITMFYILLLFLVKFLLFSPFSPLWGFRLCLPFSFPLPWCGWRIVSVGLGLGRRSAFYSQCCWQLAVVSGTLLVYVLGVPLVVCRSGIPGLPCVVSFGWPWLVTFRLSVLVWRCIVFLLAFPCTLVFFLCQFYDFPSIFWPSICFCASASISSGNFYLFMWSSSFFSISFDICRCLSSRWYSCMICFITCFRRLCSLFVVRFTRESVLFSSLCACMIFFFFIVYFKGNCPVSVSRMLVGVPCGSARIVFIAL